MRTAWLVSLAGFLLILSPLKGSASDVRERDLGGVSQQEEAGKLSPLPTSYEETSGSTLDSVVSDSQRGTTASAADQAKGEFSEGFKGVGRGFKSGTKATGRAFKKVGVTMGKGFKKAGTTMGKGFKKVGSAIKGIFVKDKAPEPEENQGGFLAESSENDDWGQSYGEGEAPSDDEGDSDDEAEPDGEGDAMPQQNNDWAMQADFGADAVSS